MRSLFVPLQLATDARGLEFITDLDENIDKVARKALYEAQGENADAITRQVSDNSDEDGIVVGDETRLRQIITNLARSASCLWCCALRVNSSVVMLASSHLPEASWSSPQS